MRVNAYAAPAAGRPLAPTTIERRDVGANDVLIEIEYAGICHSDIHTVNGDWGPQPFPVVPGHEIVGVVTEVGADGHRGTGSVTASASAAWSTPAASAPTAATATSSTACRAWSPPTPAPTATARTTQGGYSTHVVVDAGFVAARARRHRPGRRRAAAVRRHHDLLARCAAGAPGRASGSPSSASAGWATWPSSSRTRWAPR